MNKIAIFVSNSILATTFLMLVLAPVGIVARIGGIRSAEEQKPEGGITLGACVNKRGGSLSEIRKGKIEEISLTVFWGQIATYHRTIEIINNYSVPKTYQTEIVGISGTYSEMLTAKAFFQKNSQKETTLKPGESARIDLEISAPTASTRLQSTVNLKLAIWEE